MSKTIVVTGGAGGICSDICRGLATDGVKVVVADYAKEAAEKVGAEIRDNQGDAIAVQVDVGGNHGRKLAFDTDEGTVCLSRI